MSQNPPLSASQNLISCSNCHSAMPSELRFCRNCGFRLSSGLGGVDQTFNRGDMVSPGVSAPATTPKKRRRMSGMAWIFIGLLVFFIGAAAFTAIISPIKQNVGSVVRTAINRSYVGVNGWDTTENGVTFQSVDAPGGPADKAGLVGGDIITKFDGQDVRDEDQMEDLMERTPIGKPVEIEYLRDGEKKTTKLTTVSQDEFRKLVRDFERRPEGRTQFGYDDDETERVQVPGPKPGTLIYGVKLNRILNSRPADLAGVKAGDIVIEVDGIPIRTADEFLMRVRRALPYSTMKLVVVRGEEKLEVPVKVGKQ